MIPNPEYSFEAPSYKCEWCVYNNVTEPKKIEKPRNEFFEKILSNNKRRK